MPAVAYNLVFSFSGRDLSACWFWFHARVLAIAANAKCCLSSRTVDMPPRVTLTSTCSALVHFILSGHGSHLRLALFLPPLHSCPAYSSLSALPNSLLLHKNPPFFSSLFFSPPALTAASCGLSPATFLPLLLQKPWWGSCSVGGQTRATHGSAGRQRARSVMELWVAGKQIFFYMSHCKVVSWKFSNEPNALSSF